MAAALVCGWCQSSAAAAESDDAHPVSAALGSCVDPDVAGYVPTRGGRLWYRMNGVRHLGTGVPALVVVHGGPGSNHRSLVPLVALADSYPVVLYDQLDSGHSDRPGKQANWSAERFAREIDDVRAALGLRDVVVLGHSAGAAWVLKNAARQPRGLRGMILAGPLVSTRLWLDDAAALRAALPAAARDALTRHELAGTTSSAEYLAAADEYESRHLCHGPCPRPCFANGRPAFNAALYEYMWGPTEFRATGVLAPFDATAALRSARVPVLVMCGQFDEVRESTCSALAAMAPRGSAVIVPNAAHMTFLENPAASVDAVRAFLASLPRSVK